MINVIQFNICYYYLNNYNVYENYNLSGMQTRHAPLCPGKAKFKKLK